MSDDKYLGLALGCVPRRLFALVLAGFLCAFGVVSVLWAIFMRHLPGEAGPAMWHAEDRCVGHRCADMLTCRGSRQGSFHLHEVIWLVSCAPFGYWGVLGALHRHVEDLRWFGYFLLGLAVLFAALILGDGAYILMCGSYPLNVVDEALLWSVPRVPVREAVKKEIQSAMTTYSIGLINQLSGFNVFAFYVAVELAEALFLAYASSQVLQLVHHICNGSHGFGPNYDIRDWRERVLLKHGIGRMLRPNYQAAGV